MKKLLLVMVFTMFPVLAHGATYYVAKSGNDNNSCTSAQSPSAPKLTINAGLGCLGAGDTLIIKAGTYDEAIQDAIPSGTAGSPTTVRSEVQYGAILRPGDGGDANAVLSVGRGGTRQYITVDGLVLDGSNKRPPTQLLFIRADSPSLASHHLIFQNMEIRNAPYIDSNDPVTGIGTGLFARDITIRNNKIHDIGWGQPASDSFFAYCIYLKATSHTFENNELYRCSGYSIHQYGGGEETNDNIIRNNYIHDNGGPVLFACGGRGNQFHSNILARNGRGYAAYQGAGLLVAGFCSGVPATNSLVYNNTIVNNQGVCIHMGTSAAANNTTVQNNLCWQNDTDNVVVVNGSGNTISNNLLGQDPRFVNAAAGDFHLQSGSPAIDAGVVMPGLSFQGSAPDLGALESGAGGTLPAPTNLRLTGN